MLEPWLDVEDWMGFSNGGESWQDGWLFDTVVIARFVVVAFNLMRGSLRRDLESKSSLKWLISH